MAVAGFLKSGGLAALAMALAVAIAPVAAEAQNAERGGRSENNGGWRTRGADGVDGGWSRRGNGGAPAASNGGGWRARSAQTQTQAPTVSQSPAIRSGGTYGGQGGERWRGQPQQSGGVATGSGWQGRNAGGGERWRGQQSGDAGTATRSWRGQQGATTTQTTPPVSSNAGRWQGQRNGTYSDANRNRTYGGDWRNRSNRGDGQWNDRTNQREAWRNGYRQGARNDRWRDRRDVGQAYNQGWRDSNRNDRWRGDNRSGYSDARRWNRDWRRDNRYDWYGYRAHNRHHYQMGRYYAPYRNYSYRRLSIGFTLDSMFYGDSYWLNDPWSYRLPEVYGPYRWVRYYDDVLLVDIYTGEVVDVIHDFFW